MGVGRRMKKQGPPQLLDESKILALKKRKISDPDDSRAKKRKTSEQRRSRPNLGNSEKKKARSGAREVARDNQVNRKIPKGGKSKLSAKPAQPVIVGEASSDDDAADLLEEVDPNEDNTTEDLGNGILEDGGADQDDFLASGSSVYDSGAEEQAARFSDDGSGSDAEEKLTAANIEGLSRKLESAQEEEELQAAQELQDATLQTNISTEKDDLEDAQATTTSRLAPDLQLLRARMTDTIRILDNFSALRDPSRSRSSYTSQLLEDICIYYGYSPFLAEKLFSLFTPSEAFAFFESNETPRPLVIRTNTLRTSRRALAQSLINRGVTLEPVGKWSKVGLQIFESQVPLGATPEYLAGHYILQAASSFLPVMALAPQENERILEMAAAPGGKSTYIAALMKNTGNTIQPRPSIISSIQLTNTNLPLLPVIGILFANDPSRARAKALIGNIHRLGVRNAIISSHDARSFPHIIGGFDRVLLDAPCSGTGVIAKDPSIKTNKTEKDFLALPHLQKQLLLAAIDSVDHASKTGGYVVYSTCSVCVEENEQVVQYALSKRKNVRLVETGLGFGVEGFRRFRGKVFEERMGWARRFYPHRYNVDGFFVAKLRKVGPSPAVQSNGNLKEAGEMEGAVDKTPVREEEEEEEGQQEQDKDADSFASFDDAEDAKIIERARRQRLRKKGLNPKGQA
ncbi:MAG: hypothetical protein Q9219_002369 [cf. Caloplaca sp. 3 TL-2023]